MASDNNSATDWADAARKKDPETISTDLPVSTEIDPERQSLQAAAAQAEYDGWEIAQSKINQYLHDFHGTTDEQVSGAQKQAVADPRFSSTLFLTTGRIPVGQTVANNNRDKELYNPGIHVEAPGLDRWHAMNPNGRPAASDTLGQTTQSEMKQAIAKVQTPITPPAQLPTFTAPVQLAQTNTKPRREM
jgi:hypothetical protein